MTDEEKSRRDVLRALGVAASTGLSGCSALLGPGAPEIEQQTDQTEQRLQSRVPWSSYRLNYEPESVRVGKQKLQRTGVENAYTYRINIGFELAGNSDDMQGWTATTERMEELFGLLNRSTYDVLSIAVEDFQDFHPENQPSAFNQVAEYQIHVGGDGCSYVEDTVSAEIVDDILGSRSAYAEYVGGGAEYEINIESGLFGTDYFC